jgi:hypothetical protein
MSGDILAPTLHQNTLIQSQSLVFDPALVFGIRLRPHVQSNDNKIKLLVIFYF